MSCRHLRQPAARRRPYIWREGETAYLPLTVDVLRITGAAITEIMTFHDDQFPRLGLPERLPAAAPSCRPQTLELPRGNPPVGLGRDAGSCSAGLESVPSKSCCRRAEWSSSPTDQDQRRTVVLATTDLGIASTPASGTLRNDPAPLSLLLNRGRTLAQCEYWSWTTSRFS